MEDLYTGIKGIVYDKPISIYTSLKDTWQNSEVGLMSKVASSVKNTAQRIIIPTQGPGLGAGVGLDDHYTKAEKKALHYEDFQRHIDPNAPKTQNASWRHDFAYLNRYDETAVGPIKHFQWVTDTYTGPGLEPGIFGQFYRAAGTVAFPLFGVASNLTGVDL